MATGHPDYFTGVSPEKPVFGKLQTAFTKTDATLFTGGSNYAVLTYTVPAGYILNVTGVVYGCDSPGISRWDIEIEDTMVAIGHFDVFANILLNQGGEIVVKAGEKLDINIYSLLDYTAWFTAYVYGFLQQTIA